ncbi:MAG TPA: insulinase family protein, partial [Longimicrobiales bacterium]|nr:insulinase family protein [Longimicrobiales bacterium]
MSRILHTSAAAALLLATACATARAPEIPAPPAAAVPAADAPAAGTISAPPALGALRPYQLPPIEEFRLANGLRVVVVEQATMPIVAASLMVDAGAEHEPLEKAGLAMLTGSLLSEGTRSLSGPELAERMERLGAQLQTGASYN